MFFSVIVIPFAWTQGLPCDIDEDCPDPQPDNMCLQRDCWAGACMNVPAIICDDGDGCTSDLCITLYDEMAQTNTAVCTSLPVLGCCWHAGNCPEPELPCKYATCNVVNEEQGVGECQEVDLPNCCETDEECAENACEVGSCNTTTFTCNPVERMKECPDDAGNACSVPICNVSTGSCSFIMLDNETCPGACCLPQGDCQEMDKSWCDMDNGTFFGVNTFCGNITCIETVPCCLPRIRRGLPHCEQLAAEECIARGGIVGGNTGQPCDEASCPGSCENACDCLSGAELGNLCIRTWCGPEGFCMAEEKTNCPHPCV